jgi:hypothetical protein
MKQILSEEFRRMQKLAGIVDESQSNEKNIIKFLKKLFEVYYLEGGDDFKNDPGETETVTFDGEDFSNEEEYGEMANEFLNALEYLKLKPLSISFREYGYKKVSFEVKERDIVCSFIIPE